MKPLSLRVDVCTFRGLTQGVPVVLEVLRRTRSRATFCVAMGPDRSGLAMLKILRPSFALRMARSGAMGTYGIATALYGTVLPSPRIGAGHAELLRRIRSEGHALIVHGWDHRGWQDGLDRYPPGKLSREFARMIESYRTVVGEPPMGFAAPAWCVSGPLLELEAAAGLEFAADARGRCPFLPVFEGRAFAVPQLPVTLATLDECLDRMTPGHFVEETLITTAAQPEYSCFAAHAETEGGRHAAVLEELLRRLDRGTMPLQAPTGEVARAEMKMGSVPGRPYPVCVQT